MNGPVPAVSSLLVAVLGSGLVQAVLVYLLLIAGALLLGALLVLRGVRRRMRARPDPTAAPDEYDNCSSCGARTPVEATACGTCGAVIEPATADSASADSAGDGDVDASAEEEWVEWGRVEQATETERSE